ncbi:MAG: hypothetical protein GX754_01105 [Clostridiaceae bacterium]|nr:hypothetical protein [Clostridiaceae bacterium]
MSLYDATDEQRLLFNVDSVTEFVQKTHNIMKAEKPDILLYLNNSALRADVTGSNTRKVEPYVDMLGAEGGFVWVTKDSPLWHVSPMAKQIEAQSNGKPTVIFIAGDYKPRSYYMHTACETRIYYAQAVANGANVWYGIHGPTEQMDTPGGAAAVEFNKFLRKNEVFAEYSEPMEGRYLPMPETFYPGVLHNCSGRGWSIYFAATFGEFFNKYTNPDYKRMLLNAVYQFADPLVITDAPGSVEVVLRRKDDKYILHLINMTGEMERPIQRVIHIYNVKMELHLDRPASCISSITGQDPADFEIFEKGCRFTIPEIKEYEVLVIETRL